MWYSQQMVDVRGTGAIYAGCTRFATRSPWVHAALYAVIQCYAGRLPALGRPCKTLCAVGTFEVVSFVMREKVADNSFYTHLDPAVSSFFSPTVIIERISSSPNPTRYSSDFTFVNHIS